MGKRWVDITTIDNTVPFMKVRWKGTKWHNGTGPDCWFAEVPGIISDTMRWTQGTKENGWFSAHRMNGGGYRGYPMYCASFNFDHTQSGFWDVSGTVYRDHIKDVPTSATSFYDTAVVMSGETYYEVDFNLWSGASGYSLYVPYSDPMIKWRPGDIFVELDSNTQIYLGDTPVTNVYLGDTEVTQLFKGNTPI